MIFTVVWNFSDCVEGVTTGGDIYRTALRLAKGKVHKKKSPARVARQLARIRMKVTHRGYGKAPPDVAATRQYPWSSGFRKSVGY